MYTGKVLGIHHGYTGYRSVYRESPGYTQHGYIVHEVYNTAHTGYESVYRESPVYTEHSIQRMSYAMLYSTMYPCSVYAGLFPVFLFVSCVSIMSMSCTVSSCSVYLGLSLYTYLHPSHVLYLTMVWPSILCIHHIYLIHKVSVFCIPRTLHVYTFWYSLYTDLDGHILSCFTIHQAMWHVTPCLTLCFHHLHGWPVTVQNFSLKDPPEGKLCDNSWWKTIFGFVRGWGEAWQVTW